MNSKDNERKCSIGIYVRESRDDNDENFETIETQRALLLDFALKTIPGQVYAVYEDDNISGSSFERPGLNRLKRDVVAGRLDILLLKDLSRLGRNNARTLLFMDFLEEKGVRLVTFDGRYDSLRDNETAGLETWINERYVRDISRKIKSSIRFKIERGEYLGHAPFGYVKSVPGENRLYVDENNARTVKLVYRLYKSGLGYSSIAGRLNDEGLPAPGGGMWNRIAVRRILCGRVYTGDTVQGTSERISFKSRKTRRLPEGKWVITENTHEAIISREEYADVQNIRLGKTRPNIPHKKKLHPLRGLVYCGGCGSVMYARNKDGGNTAYICSNYFRNGCKSCSSHFVSEEEILGPVLKELAEAFRTPGISEELSKLHAQDMPAGNDHIGRVEKNSRQLSQKLHQQELLYTDRLEGKISEELFSRINRQMEERIERLKREREHLGSRKEKDRCLGDRVKRMLDMIESGSAGSDMLRLAIDRITVCDFGDGLPGEIAQGAAGSVHESQKGLIIVDFLMDKV